jgi:hypothetical protein
MLKPVLGGMDCILHLTVPSMNRFNQTEPATFSILPCWAFFRGSHFLYFKEQPKRRIKQTSFDLTCLSTYVPTFSLIIMKKMKTIHRCVHTKLKRKLKPKENVDIFKKEERKKNIILKNHHFKKYNKKYESSSTPKKSNVFFYN